jgi:hypothetical protein
MTNNEIKVAFLIFVFAYFLVDIFYHQIVKPVRDKARELRKRRDIENAQAKL